MTELNPQDLRRALVIEQAIDRQLDELVRRANIAAVRFKDSNIEKGQLRNLLNVAIEARSVEVVANFIRYQMGRSARTWTPTIGHGLIADLRWIAEEITPTTRQAAEEKLRQRQANTADIDSNAILVELMQRYLGYLSRAFYYAKEVKDFSKLTEVISAK